MTDETEASENTESASSTEDSRFEVKWKKKDTSARAPAATPDDEASPAALRSELDAERKRVEELMDRWQRAEANLANLRKRNEQEREDLERFASMLLVQELLPVLDNFDRALATIPGNLAMLSWIQGIMLVDRQLTAILEHRGLTPIETQGQTFNPYFHEAIGERETSEAAPGTVLQEYQRGYTMHGRVIRPALVEIAKAPAAVQSGETAEAVETRPSEQTSGADAEQIAGNAETQNTGP